MSSITQKLTQKQQRFVDEYIISGNATQAAIKAGYSKKTANRIATENLSKPVIKAAIEKRNAEIQSEKTADMTEVMEYLTSVMRGEQTESVATAKGIYDDKAAIEKRNAEIQSEKTADMTEVMEYLTSVMRGEQTESVATAKGIYDDVEVSAKDRIKAAELIGKRHGAWTDKKVISGDVQIDVGMGDYDDED